MNFDLSIYKTINEKGYNPIQFYRKTLATNQNKIIIK